MDKLNIDGHKMHYHIDRLNAWLNGETVFPIYMEISPVGHCNHRCTFCALDFVGYQTRALDTEKLKDCITAMAAGGVRSVMYAGEGEPLLHPDMALLTEHAKKNGIDVAFTTNGTAMTQKFCDQALAHISWIKVSLNAGDKETYAKIHRHTSKDDWRRVWDNIAYAVAARNSKKLAAKIGVQMVLLPENAPTATALAEQCKKIGVDYLVIKPYSHNLNSLTHEYKDLKYGQTFNDCLKDLPKLATADFEILIREKTMESWDAQGRAYSVCYSTPFFWAYIMATGDVYACSAHIGKPAFNLGNINDQVFGDIWAGEKRKKLIEQMKTFDIGSCRKNCRMEMVNRFLYTIKHPGDHKNFI